MSNFRRLSGLDLEIRTTRATVCAVIYIVIAVSWPFIATRPDAFSTPYHGAGAWIDALLKDLPPPLRLAAVCVMEVHFLMELFTVYIPALKLKTMQVFDGRNIRGFDFRGRTRSWPLAVIDRHFSALGSIFVRSTGEWFRIPLSILKISEQQKSELQSLLSQ